MRRFEFSEGSSNKFWQVTVADHDLHITWGKIGTAGQTQTKSFASAAAAQQELSKLVSEKTKKGYAEVDGTAAADGKKEEAPDLEKPAVKAAAKKSAPAASSDAAADNAASNEAATPAAGASSLPALPEHIVPDEPG